MSGVGAGRRAGAKHACGVVVGVWRKYADMWGRHAVVWTTCAVMLGRRSI